MMFTLVRKLLRDLRLQLTVIALLLAAFECLWVKIAQRITSELVPFVMGMAAAQKLSMRHIEDTLFRGPGKIMQTLMGGENIQLENAMDMLSIGYVHPLVQTILCVWAIGRAAGAIAGEIDRGTMELLLAQPVPRYKIVLAHLCVDLVTIPVLCLSLWAGTWLGTWAVGPFVVAAGDLKKFPFPVTIEPEALAVHPAAFGPGLWHVAALLFAVSGLTMWLSSGGRFRGRVLGAAVLVTLLQFLVNVVGQLWDTAAVLRPFTVFFYYQPQQTVLVGKWTIDLGAAWNHGQPLFAVSGPLVLLAVGTLGYLLALWTFCRREIPAPL